MSLPHEEIGKAWSTISRTVHLIIVCGAWAGAVALLTGVLLACASAAWGLETAGLETLELTL